MRRVRTEKGERRPETRDEDSVRFKKQRVYMINIGFTKLRIQVFIYQSYNI